MVVLFHKCYSPVRVTSQYPLTHNAQHSSSMIMMMMMSVYSEYQCVCVILYMSVITQDGLSALMWAAREGRTKVVVELVKAEANVDMQTKVCQYTYMTHDVNVQNHTSRLNSLLYICTFMYVHVRVYIVYNYVEP